MPRALIGVEGDELEYRNRAKVASKLEITLAELTDYMKDEDMFANVFNLYAEGFVYPAQQAAAADNKKSRGRGPSLTTVQQNLYAGQRPGSDKFSNWTRSKKNWTREDWLAFLLYQMTSANEQSVNGIFHQKGFDEATMHVLMWNIIKFAEEDISPTAQRRKSDKVPQVPKSIQSINALGKPPAKRQKTTDKDPAVEDPAGEASTGPVPPAPPVNQGGTEAQRVDEACSAHGNSLMFEDVPVNHDLDELFELNVDLDRATLGSAKPLTNTQRLVAYNPSKELNLNFGFWKAWGISQVTRDQDIKAFKQSIEYGTEVAKANAVESVAWMEQVAADVDEQSIQYAPFTDAMAAKFDEQQKYLHNTAFQRDDLPDAVEYLGIPWKGNMKDTLMRMPGMARSTQLTFWQPSAIVALSLFAQAFMIFGGCVLADVMGLGKTWTVIGALLHALNLRRFATPGQRVGSAQPTLIICPPWLIDQWIRAFDMMCPGVFTIYKYHGDWRNPKRVSTEKYWPGTFQTTDSIFNGSEDNASVVIIASSNTWENRHGPRAQSAWRKSTKSMTIARAQELFNVADTEWKHCLWDCFAYLVIDEAQAIKDLSANITISLLWLRVAFRFLISASPLQNGLEDWLGFAQFLEHPDADLWWSEESLNHMGLKPDVNPFTLPVEHPGAKLMFTTVAFKRFVLSSSVGEIERGKRLEIIWTKTLLRRTHSSTVYGQRIGDHLPRISAVLINCPHTPAEAEYYKKEEAKMTGALLGPEEKPKWSLKTHRSLGLLTTFVHLPVIDADQNLKASGLKKILDKPDFYLDWAKQPIGDTDKAKLEYLFNLLDGAPKIRALLRNINTQVIRDEEKALVFCQMPAVSIYLFAIFQILKIPVQVITAHHKGEERNSYIEKFNEDKKSPMILILTYAIGGTGLNLQKLCRNVHIVETAWNLGVLGQAIGRVQRLGNPFAVVYVYEYYIKGTFDDRMVQRALEKAVPQAFAELNRQIFGGTDEEGYAEIGEFVIINQNLMEVSEATSLYGARNIPRVLSPHDLIRTILMMGKGQQVDA